MGGRFQSWGHTYIYGSFVWMYDKSNRYCKAAINQLEINNFLLKKKKDMNRSTNFATNTGIPFKKLYNLRKQQKIYMAFGLVMSSNTQQKKPCRSFVVFSNCIVFEWNSGVGCQVCASVHVFFFFNKQLFISS